MSEMNNDAQSTGHVWDDTLSELTNPPPRWWMLGLHASWIFVLLYGLIYPMWPMVDSHTKGFLGWTSVKEFKEDLAEVEKIRQPFEDRISATDAIGILGDNELKSYTMASAKVLFGDNCAPCHGNGGQGNPGFPVLADDDWLFGGNVQQIQQTISMGRRGIMPAHGKQLSASEVDTLANYVANLSSGQAGGQGQELFTQKGCIGCHGMDGTGNIFLGAANLTDQIWRFSGSVEGIRHTILHGVNDPNDAQTRNAEMPAFGGKLTDDEIKKLAVYVHQLGGGQ